MPARDGASPQQGSLFGEILDWMLAPLLLIWPISVALTWLVAQGIASWPRHSMAVIGSSLGGFYASWVAQHAGCPSVMLNPAVDPARDLARYIGEQTSWHDPSERFYFLPEYIEELQALDMRARPAAARELALIAKGDEVLDWREMVGRYPQAEQVVQEGGDHALGNYGDYLPLVSQFLQLA